ncbi:MAG: toll/interleukin-1 receptor domain-containing protein [Synergistaceae bacterium]|nr:toll/interleukin-1 receptor domain-containing protein [Synergistaceae bacterium]
MLFAQKANLNKEGLKKKESIIKQKYYAFISYSHKDQKIAKKLQTRLQHYHLPTSLRKANPDLPKNLRPIFIDESNLVGSVLKEALQNNLSQSKYLILICSPNSAKSEYVNDEVRYFIENGKGDRIIPLIVDGVPHSERECFPPALLELPRERELLGIDLKKFGVRGAFLRVIATMLGLDLDNFVSYEDRIRRKRSMILTSIAAAIMFFAGFLIWQNVPHTHYYRTYVYRWEKPIGLFEVESEAARKRMAYTYKFTTLKGEVQKIERINSAGVLVNPLNPTPLLEPAKVEFRPDSSVDYFDIYGHRIYRKRHLSMRVVDFYCGKYSEIPYAFQFDNLSVLDSELEDPGTNGGRENIDTGNIIRMTLEFDDNGYIVKQIFRRTAESGKDKRGFFTRDKKGRWGLGYTVDELGRITAIHNLNLKWEIMPIQGIYTQKFDYENSPYPVKISYAGKDGEPVEGEDGYAFTTVSYDEYFNAVKVSNFDTDGKLTTDISETRYTYDTNGFRTSESYYDANLEPILVREGYFCVKFTNDTNGRIIRGSYYNTKNEKTVCLSGYAEFVRKLNENGQLLLETYYDVEGNSVANYHNNIVYACKITYENGFIHKIENLDQNGNLTLNDEDFGYASQIRTYDTDDDKIVGITYLDTEGNKILISDGFSEGFAEIRYTYDTGNITSVSFYGDKGEAVCVYDTAKTVYEWENGSMISVKFFGTDGNPAIARGYSKAEYEYDENGLQIWERYYGVNGERVNTTFAREALPGVDGRSAIKHTYDSDGNELTYEEFDANDNSISFSVMNISDEAEKVEWLRNAAEQGDARAQYTLGEMYHGGLSVEKKYVEAAKWFRKAAEQGYAYAQFNLGNMYYNGEGVKKNKSEAVKWFRKAADQGYAYAQFNLGNMYYNGEGIKKNKSEAAKWFRKAAEQGDAEAQFNLGDMYYNGDGVKKNKSEAVKWFKEAALREDNDAQYTLGVMYYNGEGVVQNKPEAVEWFTKAAEGGVSEAVEWLRKASKQGVIEAQNALKELGETW